MTIGEIGERPWGHYEVLDESSDYKVKRISVLPHGRLSLQSHKHRSEHWVVVAGIAHVTIGDKTQDMKPNQAAYIPKQTKHRLENKENEPMILIEVQIGEYLGEDDITRYEDAYGRE